MSSTNLSTIIPIIVIALIVVTTVFPAWKFFNELRGGGMSKKFRQNRQLAIGTLREMSSTGVYINEQPKLALHFEVSAPGGVKFLGTAQQVIPHHQLGQIQPGITLPVWYDPTDSSGKVVIANDADPRHAEELIVQMRVESGKMSRLEYEIHQRGIVAPAVIMNSQPTGEVRDGDSVVALTLRVNQQDGTSFDATVEKPIPQSHIGEVQQGRTVNVTYLPGEKSTVLLHLAANV